jgi:membrane protein
MGNTQDKERESATTRALVTEPTPRRFSAKTLLKLLRLTWKEWKDDNGTSLAAALAYYTVFSLAPILIIAVAVAGLVFGEEAARGELTAQISSFVGDEGAELAQEVLANTSKPTIGSLAGVIGLLTLLFGATGAFSQMQSSLNHLWNVPSGGPSGIWNTVTTRAISFLLVLGVGLLLLTMLILSAVISALTNILGASAETAQMWGQIINFVVSFGLTMVMFALLYKVLPDVDIDWSDVWVGAMITAILFTIGKQLIGLYLGRASVASAYGAAGSLVIVMLWVYYSAQILFLGAEFTQVYTRMFGSRRDERAMLTTHNART